MKKLFGKFLFTTVIIACASAFFAGQITVSERGEYNLNMTKYAVMSFSGTSQKLEAKYEENRLRLEVPLNKFKEKFEKYVCLTPLSPFYYLSRCTDELHK